MLNLKKIEKLKGKSQGTFPEENEKLKYQKLISENT